MKLPASLYLFGGVFVLGAPDLRAQPAAGTITPASGSAAIAWTQGFEPSEGYTGGQFPVGSPVTVMGGTATVVSGGAAEGAQFLRFAPSASDNALVLTLSPEVAGGSERTIRFKVRLVDAKQDSRLVLSYGETVALRPVAAGLVIEAGAHPPRQVSVPLPEKGWLEIGLRESASAGTWDLLVAGQPAIAGLPLHDVSSALSDLLIFADGALDLDAVQVIRTAGGENVKPATTPSPDAIFKAVRTARGADWARQRGETLAQALARAKAGDLAGLEALVETVCEAEPDTPQWHLEKAQMLGIVAFALRDGGRHVPAAMVGRLALKPLDQARSRAGHGASPDLRATCEFVAARFTEQFLGDEAEAARQFQQALAFKPDHLAAQIDVERLTRQRELAAKDPTIVKPDASTGSGLGGGK